MRRFFTLFIVLIFSGVLASAQSKVVSGQVRDAQGNPVGFASVTEKGTNNAVTTESTGSFSIRTKGTSGILVISVVGYDKQEVPITGNAVTAVLVRNTQELTTVVVTALGQVRQAKELGYSTAKVRSTELNQAKVVNLQNGLTGKVSGLNIQTVNSGVFANTRILLRGIRSLTGNNQPMFIVDGVPVSLGFINSVNPNDIADVNILKSASATAIYGPEGANGAILITMKKGSKLTPVVTLSHTTQIEKVTFMPRFQSQFGSGSAENADYTAVYDPIENQGYGPAFGDLSLATTDPTHFRIRDGKLESVIGRDGPGGVQEWIPYYAQPNEKKSFWNTGITNQTDFSIGAGDFYLSLQNVDIKGVMPRDRNKRVSVNVNASKDVGTKLKTNFRVQYTQQNYDVNAGNQYGNGRDYTPYWNLINSPMHIPITKYKNWQSDYFSSPDGYYNDYYYNPYWTVDNFRERGKSDDIIGNVMFDYKLTPSINLTYRLGVSYSNTRYKSTQGAFTYSEFAKASGKSNAQSGDLPSAVLDGNGTSTRLNSEIFGTWRKEVGKFKFEVLLGQSYRETKAKDLNITNRSLGIPEVFNTATHATETGSTESTVTTKLARYYGKLNIGFNSWAFLEFTGSSDADSRLANHYNYVYSDISDFYPGASLSLLLSEAIPAIKNSHFISAAKLRGSISKTASSDALGAQNLENTYSQTNGFPYDGLIGFSSNDVLHQSSYEPEKVQNSEVGIEVGFMKNRFNFEATVYQQKNTNQLITVDYSAATGYPKALLNAADFTNKGIELDLKLTPLIKIRNLTIDYKINYSHQTNKVNKLLDGVDELSVGNGNYVVVGQPAYVFKVSDYERIDGKVVVTENGYPKTTTTLSQFGRTLPTDLLGMTLTFNFKGLTLSAVADYHGGNQILSLIGGDMDFSGISYRSGQNGRQPFLFPNSIVEHTDDAGVKTYTPNTSTYTQDGGYNFWSQARNTAVNSNYLCSGAFWKLREVALTYTFPVDVLPKKVLKGASISISGRNLVTWLPKTNEWTDPEFSNTTGNAQGVNTRDNNPPTRVFGANLTLTF